MKRAAPFLLMLVLLAACAIPAPSSLPTNLTPEVLATPSATARPTRIPGPPPTSLWLSPTLFPTLEEMCAYSWSSRGRPLFSRVMEFRIKAAGVPDISFGAGFDGEECVGPDGRAPARSFGVQRSQIYISVRVADVHDRGLLDGYTLTILRVLREHRGIPGTWTRGVDGEIVLSFISPTDHIDIMDVFGFLDLPDQYPTGDGLLDAMGAQIVPIPTLYPTLTPTSQP